jgi:hypothetical protein
VAASFERRVEEEPHDLLGKLRRHDTRPDRQDVGVVVRPRHAGGVQVVAQRGARTVHLVRRNLLTLAAAAEHDAAFGVAAHDRAGDGRTVRRVVDRVLGVRAEVVDIVAPLLQQLYEMLLQWVSGVVAADRNPHSGECTQGLAHPRSTFLPRMGQRGSHVTGAGISDELPRVTPSLLRRADTMCRRRLAHEHESGRKLSPLGDAPFEVSNRLTADAITWHRGAVAPEHGFPDPIDLEPEQRAVYRAAANAYLRMFGAAEIAVDDLGWSTDLVDVGVRLLGPIGIPVVHANGTHELRILRMGARLPLIDSVDIRFALLRAHDWAAERVHIVAVDLLEDLSVEYELDMGEKFDDAYQWLVSRVEVIRARAHPRHTAIGGDCRDCPCIPGCPQLTRLS